MNIDKALEVLEERKFLAISRKESVFYEAVAEVVKRLGKSCRRRCACKACIVARNLVRAIEGLG